MTQSAARVLLDLGPHLLIVAALLGLAAAGAATLARALIGALSVNLLLVKPWSCDLCLSAWGCATGGLVLGVVLRFLLGAWAVPATILTAGAALMLAVLILKLKTRLET